jgi:hypothetical protein
MKTYFIDIDAMAKGYAEAGLWSSSCNGLTEHGDCRGDDCDVSLYSIGYEVSNLPVGVLTSLRNECADFVALCEDQRPDVFKGLNAEQVGHDFWLTARRHGAGFWDRGLGERGDFLTEWAHTFSGNDFYVDSNGEIDY